MYHDLILSEKGETVTDLKQVILLLFSTPHIITITAAAIR